MWKKIKNTFDFKKGVNILAFTQFFAALIGVIFTIFAAPILGAENFGLISYFLAITFLAFMIASIGVGNVLLVYLSKGIKLFSTMSLITLVISIFTSIIVFLIFNEIIFVILIISHVLFELAINELLSKQLYTKYLKYFLSQRIIFVTLAIPLFFLMGYTGFLLAYGLSMLVGIGRVYLGFKETKINFTLVKERSNFIFNNYIQYGFRTGYVYVDRLIIYPIFGPALLGNYELAMQGVILGNVFSTFVFNYLLPKDSRNEITYRIKLYSIAGSILISFLVIFISPYVLPLIFPEYEDAVDLISIMGISIVPHLFVVLYVSKFLATDKAKVVLIGSAIHFIVLLSLILILTHYFSTMGLVVAFVLCEIIEAVFLMIMYKKTFKTFL